MLHNVVLTTICCDPTTDYSKCEESLKRVKRKYSSSLFQHIGVESSLKGKMQTLKVFIFSIFIIITIINLNN